VAKFMAYPASLEACSLYDYIIGIKIFDQNHIKYWTALYHVIHLVSDVLKPILYALDPRYHSRQLASDNGL